MLRLNLSERNEQWLETELHKLQEKLLPFVGALEVDKMVESIKGKKETVPACPAGYRW
jgi:hypothetical protein